MNRSQTLVGILLLCGLTSSADLKDNQAEVPSLPPVLTWKTYEAWKKTIEPTARELAWREIPWLPSFGSGIRRASEERKPVLLWVMNGHPLGAT